MSDIRRVQVNTGKTRILVADENDNELGILEFYPSDMNLPERLKKGWKVIEKVLAETQKRVEESDDIKELSELFVKTDKAVKEELDYIFDTDVSGVFGNTSFVTPTKSGFLIENIMNAILPVIEDEMKQAGKKSTEKVNKYTQRYHK